MTVLTQILEQAKAWSVLEIIAVAAALAYLVLAIRQSVWCWLFAAMSTAIYIWLFVDARLYMESILNVFYLVMAVYGWLIWTTGASDSTKRPVVTWPARIHLLAISAIAVLSLVNGYLLSAYSNAAFPFVDSATTWFAIWATFLVARKVLENWWYWLVIDIASVLIYWSRDLQLTSILFALYVVMIPVGLMSWRKSMREQFA